MIYTNKKIKIKAHCIIKFLLVNMLLKNYINRIIIQRRLLGSLIGCYSIELSNLEKETI